MSSPTWHPEGLPQGPPGPMPATAGLGPQGTLLAPPAPASDGAPAPTGPGDWPPWAAFAALLGAFALAVVGALFVDIPASLLGVRVMSSTLPPGLELADTVVQDAAFVASAVLFAHVGVRTVRAWHFGLRPPQVPWRRALLAIPLTYLTFFLFDVIWAELLNVNEKEKLLETLGANEGVALLLLSAALTCVMAPICEEFLFRGFFFRALSNWRGKWPAAVITGVVFGGVHAGSAPVVDLVPLAFLGFALCVLYSATGSLYPCIAVHALNNCIAFGSLEGWWWWQVVLLIGAAMGVLVLLALSLKRAGVIDDEPARSPPPLGAAA
jgi:membrane protease YdiL (CAAX protease family)